VLKKFKVWDFKEKKFDYFELSNITVGEYRLSYERLYQFIGILDSNMKEIYEDDVVRFKTDTKEDIGIVRYMNDYCSYVVEVQEGYDLFADISFDSLEVVGTMVEDYMYNVKGELIKKLDSSNNSTNI
jgi:uncharacterized phage protein (TIGR01671 family)